MANHSIARRQAQTVVDLFLEVLLSRDSDAGWAGDSVIGRLVDFKGELPQSSGFSGFSKVYENSKWLRDWSDHHKMACVLMRAMSDRQREALCLDRAYRNRVKVAVDPFTPDQRVEIHWTDDACAQQLRCTKKAFQDRVHNGYCRLEELLADKIAA
ncbi:hypothetical protein [Marinobacter salarius]|uniref:hypothetical protein n=1 Tax=Marinobacter salarius TaxID=1420917 RepID=UPI00241FFC8C|nr:hypothetical protein [Marinobacter salarius]